MPIITKANYQDIDSFVQDNLEEYNNNPSLFSQKKIKENYKKAGFDGKNVIDGTAIEDYLRPTFEEYLKKKRNMKSLINEYRKITANDSSGIKQELINISNRHSFCIKHVEKHYIRCVKEHMKVQYYKKEPVESTQLLNRLLSYAEHFSENDSLGPRKYIENEFKRGFARSLDLVLNIGFHKNITLENDGRYTAISGDAAELIFVARAMLAGFNCSKVDVNSSSYDAIISPPNSETRRAHLKTVQIKGMTIRGDQSKLDLIKRPRGGSGSDTDVGRNRSKVISQFDADILVGVDKAFGTCYLIPMKDVQAFLNNGKKSLSLDELEMKYKENWEIVFG